jgi:hypothetical protein
MSFRVADCLKAWVAAGCIVAWAAGGVRAEGENPIARAAEPDPERADLRAQVARVTQALASARAEADALRAELDGRDLDKAGDSFEMGLTTPEASVGEGIALADVNRTLRMVILNAGSRRGVRPGMVFMVMQGDTAVARVRVVDVRKEISGAVVEESKPRRYPEVHDRLVMSGDSATTGRLPWK